MRAVLVVEDDPDVRETIQMVLEAEGHQVLTANNGAGALELLREQSDHVALILLDVVMPVMDGWTFLEKRKEMPSLKQIPTVVISAAQPTHPICEEATAFLAKPVSTEQLLWAVSQYAGQ